jgi:hypothetical protein
MCNDWFCTVGLYKATAIDDVSFLLGWYCAENMCSVLTGFDAPISFRSDIKLGLQNPYATSITQEHNHWIFTVYLILPAALRSKGCIHLRFLKFRLRHLTEITIFGHTDLYLVFHTSHKPSYRFWWTSTERLSLQTVPPFQFQAISVDNNEVCFTGRHKGTALWPRCYSCKSTRRP